MGIGETIEIFKEKGRPEDVARALSPGRDQRLPRARPHPDGDRGAVTTEHSHPFSAGLDFCLVHNGSLSNHHRLRVCCAATASSSRRTTTLRSRPLSDLALRQGARWSRRCEAALDGWTGSTPSRWAPRTASRGPRRLRLQARRGRRDGRLGRDGLGVPLPGASAGRRAGGICEPAPAISTAGRGLAVIEVDLPAAPAGAQPVPAQPGGTRGAWRVMNPAAGCRRRRADADGSHVEGHVGYYGAGMNKRPGHRPRQRRPGVAENIMSGVVRVRAAPRRRRASGHGGLVVVEGDASSRCGISMKGADIVVGGRVGHRAPSWRRRAGWWCAATPGRAWATRSTRRCCSCAARSRAWAPTASRRR